MYCFRVCVYVYVRVYNVHAHSGLPLTHMNTRKQTLTYTHSYLQNNTHAVMQTCTQFQTLLTF